MKISAVDEVSDEGEVNEESNVDEANKADLIDHLLSPVTSPLPVTSHTFHFPILILRFDIHEKDDQFEWIMTTL